MSSEKDPSLSEICDILVTKVEQIWMRASVPIVSSKRILQMIKDYHAKYRNLLRPKSWKGSNKFDLEKKLKCLFDIAACKYVNFNSYSTCIKEKKVLHTEQEFLNNQHSKRIMAIGYIDIATTSPLRKKEASKSRELQKIVKFNQERKKKMLIHQKQLLATMTVLKNSRPFQD